MVGLHTQQINEATGIQKRKGSSMKHVTGILFEKGDYIQINNGYHKGKVAIVIYHDKPEDDVCYYLLGADKDNEDYISPKYVKYLPLKDANILLSKLKDFIRAFSG